MTWLVVMVCALVAVMSFIRDRDHALLALLVGLVYAVSWVYFKQILPPANELGAARYGYCVIGELALMLCCMIAATKSPAGMVIAALSVIAIFANASASADFETMGPGWQRYTVVILATQYAKALTIIAFSPRAVAAMLSAVDWLLKRQGDRQWQARVLR